MKKIKVLLLLDYSFFLLTEDSPFSDHIRKVMDSFMEKDKEYEFILSPSLEEVKILGGLDPSDKITPMMYSEKQFVCLKAIDEVWFGDVFTNEPIRKFVISILRLAKKYLGESNVKPIGSGPGSPAHDFAKLI